MCECQEILYSPLEELSNKLRKMYQYIFIIKRGEENEMGSKATGHLFKKQTREKTKNVSNAVWMLKKSEYAPFSCNYFFSFVVEFNFVFTQSVYLLNI